MIVAVSLHQFARDAGLVRIGGAELGVALGVVAADDGLVPGVRVLAAGAFPLPALDDPPVALALAQPANSARAAAASAAFAFLLLLSRLNVDWLPYFSDITSVPCLKTKSI